MFRKLCEEIWERLEAKRPKTLFLKGEALNTVPDLSFEAIVRDADAADYYFCQLQSQSEANLTFDEKVHRRSLLFEMDIARKAADYEDYRFSICPNNIAFLGALLPQIALSDGLCGSEFVDQYVSRLEALGKGIGELEEKVHRQYKKGIILPAPALPGALAALDGLRKNAFKTLELEGGNRPASSADIKIINQLIQDRIAAPLSRVMEFLQSEDYRSKAPDLVGITQYPGGEEAYRYFVRRETASDSSYEAMQQKGFELIERSKSKLGELKDSIGIPSEVEEPTEYIRKCGRFVCQTPQEVEGRFTGFLKAAEAGFSNFFNHPPSSGYGVKRLRPELEQGLTFGYFQIPTAANPNGIYFYNGQDLSSKVNISHAALVYHELIPGHHHQMAKQLQNENLPPSRRYSLHAAYNEGWAEYASSLGLEMGLYEDPVDQYGRYLAELFLGVRLVTDVALNTQVWNIEQAVEFMFNNSILSKTEIKSEVLRYSTDLNAQALAYGWGYLEFWYHRQQAEKQLGSFFNIRKWHDEVLAYGSVPLPVLKFINDQFVSHELTTQ